MSVTTLSSRALNRALLERQFLLKRTARPPLEVVKRLVAMQAQEPNWPYIGLWARVKGFVPAHLHALLEDRTVVRSGLLRATMHLAAADDYRAFRPLLQPVLDRTARSPYVAGNSAGLDPADLVAAARQELAGATLPRRELARRLADRYPGRDGRLLAAEAELRSPLVHDPETGGWGAWGTRRAVMVTPVEPAASGDLRELVRRYLAAFGPATVKDVQAWSGLTHLSEITATMHGELRPYRGPGGAVLLDLADLDLPDPDSPTSVRLLPAYDNLLLGHADRTRVIGDHDRRQVMPGRARVLPTLLIDGLVRGTWSVTRQALHITPFEPLSPADHAAVEDEADHLLEFVGVRRLHWGAVGTRV
ncbi:winged helix DNA-binding domain-containing protein [Nonomuraea sp. NPDC052265]|uniref:winged helix DNA-binding domain-containing protein n=1 Tax=Nonomuraea sp. NPDC052265 TaxID=3364374 RepID=UPI0037CC4857